MAVLAVYYFAIMRGKLSAQQDALSADELEKLARAHKTA
jgi:hypothetical protein